MTMNWWPFSARIRVDLPRSLYERIGSVIDRSGHAESIFGCRPVAFALSIMSVVSPACTTDPSDFSNSSSFGLYDTV